MYNIIDELKLMGVNEENIIFISFESREYAYIDNSQQLDEMKSFLIKFPEKVE